VTLIDDFEECFNSVRAVKIIAACDFLHVGRNILTLAKFATYYLKV